MVLPAERQQRIANMVRERGSVRVAEISRLFDVTEETVRRDLDRLEEEGKLRRSHGGAVRIDKEEPETHYLDRGQTNLAEKMQIAGTAVNFIRPGDRIILDASSTALSLAQAIPDIPLMVLTNSVLVALELANRERIEVIGTGGILRATSLSFVGPLAESNISQYHVGKAFLSCKGVHAQHGVSETSMLQALVKQKMMHAADEVFILADYSKIGVRDFTHVASLHDVDTLITDSSAPSEALAPIRHLGVQVIAAQQA